MKPKTIFLLTILMVYALGIAAQSVLTTDAMIRVAEQKTGPHPLGIRQNQCQAGTGVHPGSCYGNC